MIRRGFSLEAARKFYDQYPVRRFQKGELILVQGEVPTSTYVIKSGIVKSYNLTTQGEEKPISFDITYEVFPVAWLFGRTKIVQFYYEAFTDCEVYAIPRNEYIDYLKKRPEMLLETFETFISSYINFQMRVNALEQSKATEKVIHTIHFLCLRFGRDIRENLVKIEIPLTQQDLANYMGLTRETTGIELKKLQRQGILTYKKQSYIVKTDKLNELLDDDYDPNI